MTKQNALQQQVNHPQFDAWLTGALPKSSSLPLSQRWGWLVVGLTDVAHRATSKASMPAELGDTPFFKRCRLALASARRKASAVQRRSPSGRVVLHFDFEKGRLVNGVHVPAMMLSPMTEADLRHEAKSSAQKGMKVVDRLTAMLAAQSNIRPKGSVRPRAA